MHVHKGKVIGLTGNISSGKSTVAHIIRDAGVPVIDADQVARDVVEPGQPALNAIASTFGPGVIAADGTLDRVALRKLAFSDEQMRQRLEAILHPAIAKRSYELFEEQFARGATHVVYEASLIFEAGRSQEFDGILVVTADPSVQKTRLLARDPSLSAELADQMIASQMAQTEKARRAKWVIENNASLDELKRRVLHWLQQNIKK